MVVLNKFFQSVYLAVVYASLANAKPTPETSSKHASRAPAILMARGLEVESFYPETKYEVFGAGVDRPVVDTLVAGDVLKESAKAFVSSRLKVDTADVVFKSGLAGESAEYAYVKQAHNDIPFANAVGNIAFKGNKVVAFGSSFVKPSSIADSTPSIDAKTAIATAEEALGAKYNGHATTLEYVVKPDGSAALAHTVQVQDAEAFTWFEAFVDAHDGSVIAVTDFVNDAAYTVLPINKDIIPDGLEVVVDPADPLASPNGWHISDGAILSDTSGNNVVAYKGLQTNLTIATGPDNVFNYTYDSTLAPAAVNNVNAARVNAFYLINTVHDTTYRYGFTEAAFNFQTDNYGLGGVGNDRVLMSVQDSSGTNNANFATPPDGQSGTCRMYIWTLTTPNRDGSLETCIPIHELGHGVSNRMTGGGTGRCLQTTESRGMGEGWSDALANWFSAKEDFKDWALAPYVFNNPVGLRQYPYSVNATVNPLRYSNLQGNTLVHSIGTVWANMLHNILAQLITKYGFSYTARTNPDTAEGNVVFLHLFLDSFLIQPCNPTFRSARDAWLQADVNRYGGVNRCLLWGVFASRGLGFNATSAYVNNFDLPADCVV